MVTRETSIRSLLAPLGLSVDVAEAAERLEKYTDLLTDVALPRGYLGPAERDEILDRHVLEAVGLSTCLPQRGITLDVGSGAGLPGVPLACVRSDDVVLLETQARRVQFLRETIAELGLTNVEIVHTRAEEAGRPSASWREAAPIVVARALADLRVTAELTLPMASVGGVVVVPIGAKQARSQALVSAVQLLGGSDPSIVSFKVPGADSERYAMMIEKCSPTPERFPRRPGVPARDPLGDEA